MSDSKHTMATLATKYDELDGKIDQVNENVWAAVSDMRNMFKDMMAHATLPPNSGQTRQAQAVTEPPRPSGTGESA